MANIIPDYQQSEIKRKAEAGIPLDVPTPEKQAMYDEIYYNPTNVMNRQQGMSDGRLSAIEQMLRDSANSAYQSQEAVLAQTRDAELAALQKALNDAVSQGNMSVREAERQFEANKSEIERMAYQDAQRTNISAESRGIANSQQLLGLMAGDNARKTSLINKNMTDRDMRVNDIRDRLNAVKSNISLDMAGANSRYGYAAAGARGQVDAQLMQQLAGMHMSDYEMSRQQQFGLDQMGLQNVHNTQQQARQHEYVLAQMAEAFGYDLKRMDAQQIHELERMAKAYDYDLGKMAQAFKYDSSLQNASFAHQSKMQQAGFKHDKQMLSAKQKQEIDNYELMLQRELAGYTKGTPEYNLRQHQIQSSMDAVYFESHAKFMSDVMGKSFADHVGNPPKHPGNKASNAQIDKYNQEVNAWNSKLESYMSNPANLQTFITKLPNAPYSEKQKKAFTSGMNLNPKSTSPFDYYPAPKPASGTGMFDYFPPQ